MNKSLSKSKKEKFLDGVYDWCAFWRANPHRFVEDYLGIKLKMFQQIIIYYMNIFNYIMYFASRGQGKTFLTAIYCCVRCILYPGTKIIVAAGTKKQTIEVINKIMELQKNSYNLNQEISVISDSVNGAKCEFKNGSWIKTVVSNDNARSGRANLLICDEFRMIEKDVVNKVLRKFCSAHRQPKYLNNPKYKHLTERNKEIYLSSCWYQNHWAWEKALAYFKAMKQNKKYFICGIPYQVAIAEGLLDKEQVQDEMSESDFDEIGFYMEMECMFFGESEFSYFKLDDLSANRGLPEPLYPKSLYNNYKDSKFKYKKKEQEEIRILSCDIAVSAGNKNDASIFSILTLHPTKQATYERRLVYMESYVGEHSVSQALKIRELYEEFDCDYIVLDTNGVGYPIYDLLCSDSLIDRDKGIPYDPLSCINDEEKAERCKFSNAPKVIYSVQSNGVKGNKFNSDIAILLKDSLKRGKLKLLSDTMQGKEWFKNKKFYNDLTKEEQMALLKPYDQTTLFINETINLEADINTDTNIVRLKEPRSGRKDRYMSIAYGNYFSNVLEQGLRKEEEETDWEQAPQYVSNLTYEGMDIFN